MADCYQRARTHLKLKKSQLSRRSIATMRHHSWIEELNQVITVRLLSPRPHLN